MHRILSIEKIEKRTRRESGGAGFSRPGKGRVRVMTEDGESFVISSAKAARLGLSPGEEPEEDVYAGLMNSLSSACMQRCGTLLGSRDYSEHRLREKLKEAGYPSSVIEETIGKLRRAGYLDDRRFARNYVRSHIRDRSRLRIMRDLAGKGIAEEIVEEAFTEIGGEEDLEDAQRQQVIRLLQKRGFDPSEASFEERQKTMAFLHRKGYPADLIRRLAGSMEV